MSADRTPLLRIPHIHIPRARRPMRRPTAREAARVAVVLLLLAVSLVVLQAAWMARNEIAYNQSNLFRLHIRANSNSPVDQAQKIKIRDAVLAAFGAEFARMTSAAEAEAFARSHLADIEAVAALAAAQNGPAYPVRGQVGPALFPTRTYGAVVVPSGWYRSLQLAVGEGRGDNWWCVLFPPLCLNDLAVVPESPAGSGALTEDLTATEMAVLVDPDGENRLPVELRWKIIEWAKAAQKSARALLTRLARSPSVPVP